LAIAVRVARREALPDPVPATARFPQIATADEAEWQERVVTHLGLSEWLRLEFDDELDLVGPIATQVMGLHGLTYPSNLHLLVPLMEHAQGGSLITGIGGDETLASGSRALGVLAGHRRPTSRDVLRTGLALAPRSLRQVVLARRHPLTFPWLAPAANGELARAYARDLARFPLRWDARVREWWRSRYLHLTLQMAALLAADSDVEIAHPFLDAGFVSSLAADVGARGFRNRAYAMELLFGDVLPPEVRRRRTKASFDAVLWNRHSRAFAAELVADRLDRTLHLTGTGAAVDPAGLARVWSEPAPPANSFLLLKACWLAASSPNDSAPARRSSNQ
jgi:asparagine synthase (glutamine-hydrolysing)